MLGPPGGEASALIRERALALELHAFLEAIGLTIHPHPTLGEGMMEAAMNGLGHAIHILDREQSARRCAATGCEELARALAFSAVDDHVAIHERG